MVHHVFVIKPGQRAMIALVFDSNCLCRRALEEQTSQRKHRRLDAVTRMWTRHSEILLDDCMRSCVFVVSACLRLVVVSLVISLASSLQLTCEDCLSSSEIVSSYLVELLISSRIVRGADNSSSNG